MPDLPTGTVTFLFTDVEGSTALVTTLKEQYGSLLERHNQLLRAALAGHEGTEVVTEGDAFFAVFRSPLAAVRAAADAQRALHAEQWPASVDVRVRMGLHTGDAILGGDNYVGLDVHRAARIASAGHGGQVLMSNATRALVEPALPDDLRLSDLGAHRLKGLPSAERIYQLAIDGLPAQFPPLASLDARPNNLPASLTSFVGRERQVAEVRQRVSSGRLITLTGPGGTGKTRLGLRVAEELVGEFENGCWFVALDRLRDPALLPATIAHALGVRVAPDEAEIDALEAWLSQRELLLVLDNFEQIGAAAPHVARLLASAPRLRVLATSRTPLHVYGELEYPVPPLGSAAELRQAAASAERLSQYEAVQLFIERALAVKPDFRVTNANAPAVAEICARLDGLPLAIELAAARIKLLTPEQMLARLERSLSFLASPAQDLPERQKTLRGAIDWSYELLSVPEQQLFARLAVFRGGFTLAAAEEVTAASELTGDDLLEALASLVDKSLLRADESGAEARFGMLETIREYARERLAESGELDGMIKRHAEYYFRIADEAEGGLASAGQAEWLDRLTLEHDNLRAAYERAPEQGMIDEALSSAGAMWRFWQLRGYFAEARMLFERLLGLPSDDAAARARALTGAGGIAYWQADYEAMTRFYREARHLYEQIGDQSRLAEALYNESYVPLLQGNLAGARPSLERAIEIFRQTGDEVGAARAEFFLGMTTYMAANVEEALDLSLRAVEAYRRLGASWNLADSLTGVAYIQATAGRWADAEASLREALALMRDMDSMLGLAMVFETTAAAAAWTGDPPRAARLMGKSDAMKDEVGGRPPSQLFDMDAYRERARRELGDETFDRLADEGRALATYDAVRLVEQFTVPVDAPPLPPPTVFSR